MFFFLFGVTAPNGPGPPHSPCVQITHNDTPQSVGLLWMNDWSLICAET